jgi:hypothetical protein
VGGESRFAECWAALEVASDRAKKNGSKYAILQNKAIFVA